MSTDYDRAGQIVHDYASEYEHREPDYTPSEGERAMLEDFGNGLIDRLEENGFKLVRVGQIETV